MVPWIQIYSNLPRHPKVTHLADALGLASAAVNPNAVAAGLLVCLWTWAVQNAPDGDLSRVTARAVAEACLWKRKPQTLVDALRESGFLDPDGRLHDWEEYEGMFLSAELNRREKSRQRSQKYRDKIRDASHAVTRDEGVTSRPRHAPKPDQTITQQEQELRLLPEERKRKERSAFAESFYAGCEGSTLRAKAVIAVMEARRARERGDGAEASRWIETARAGGLTVDEETLEYEG